MNKQSELGVNGHRTEAQSGDQQSKEQIPKLWHKINFSLCFILYMRRLIWQMGIVGGMLTIRLLGDLILFQWEVERVSEDDSSEKADCKEKYIMEVGSLFGEGWKGLMHSFSH